MEYRLTDEQLARAWLDAEQSMGFLKGMDIKDIIKDTELYSEGDRVHDQFAANAQLAALAGVKDEKLVGQLSNYLTRQFIGDINNLPDDECEPEARYILSTMFLPVLAARVEQAEMRAFARAETEYKKLMDGERALIQRDVQAKGVGS